MRSPDKDASGEAHTILERRAQRLAQPIETDATLAETIELLHFDLARERYAIETAAVLRIARIPEIRRVPGVPGHFVGVINLHGEIVALIDLCALIGIARGDGCEGSRAVILGRDRIEFGIVVDDIGDIETISVDVIDDSLRDRSELSFVRGAYHGGIVVLDGAALLNDSRLFVGQNTRPILPQETTE